jgi:hypothetical protein
MPHRMMELFVTLVSMKCPNCNKEMRLVGNDESHNPKTNDVYDRKVYSCDKDDAWMTTEIPKEK